MNTEVNGEIGFGSKAKQSLMSLSHIRKRGNAWRTRKPMSRARNSTK